MKPKNKSGFGRSYGYKRNDEFLVPSKTIKHYARRFVEDDTCAETDLKKIKSYKEGLKEGRGKAFEEMLNIIKFHKEELCRNSCCKNHLAITIQQLQNLKGEEKKHE